MYFEWSWISELAKVAWISFQEMESIVNNHISFRKYIDTDWVEWKKCKNCLVWKKLKIDFHKRWLNSYWNQIYSPRCNSCTWIIVSNIKKLLPKEKKEELRLIQNERAKKSRAKNKDQYNLKRREKYNNLDLFEKIKVRVKENTLKKKGRLKLKHNQIKTCD